MKILLYKTDIRLAVGVHEYIVYRIWPFRFRKVGYPSGTLESATGYLSEYRSPSEKAAAHREFLAHAHGGEAEADALADGGGTLDHQPVREGGAELQGKGE